MIVIFSPEKGFFIGCEEAGGQGGPLWSENVKEALNLDYCVGDFEFVASHHLSYLRPDQPDTVAFRGTRSEIVRQAVVYSVHMS